MTYIDGPDGDETHVKYSSAADVSVLFVFVKLTCNK